MYTSLDYCRVSGSDNLVNVLSLGQQYLTGVFPEKANQSITRGPLELVWCPDSGLLQLGHSYSSDEMYGDNYGYRSGLNTSMVNHLTRKINILESFFPVPSNGLVLDIGSNDATSLHAYNTPDIKRIGIDPTANKFASYYSSDMSFVPQFFNSENFWANSSQPADIITSISMFYDLEDPVAFARDIESCLSHDGVWHLEQSYMPLMLKTTSYDTVCHEHLEYYSLAVLERILDSAGLRILDFQMNAVNGGSFAVTASKKRSKWSENSNVLRWARRKEATLNLHSPKPYRDFEDRVFQHRYDLLTLLREIKSSGKTILGYGASTKGNVLLQFCNIDTSIIDAIIEVNPFKFGKFTPGTNIPIISEEDASSYNADYYLLLPWHFKDGIIARESQFLSRGGKFIVPFPEIEIV